jgi:flagellar motor switch protein FliM
MSAPTSSKRRRQLSQREIDAVFESRADAGSAGPDDKVEAYDFLRPDRIPPAQLRAIQFLHENFARSLASSLSAFLRSYVQVNLASFEQISYSEFVDGLQSPTVITGLSLRPYEGYAVAELSPSLFFPALETLLGGSSQAPVTPAREITDVEERLLEAFLRVILQDLREAWRQVAPIDFTVQAIEKEPQFLQVLGPSEAVVAIGMEVRIGTSVGTLNIAIPSLLIKMMRQRFDEQWTTRRSQCTAEERQHMLRLVSGSEVQIEAKLPVRRVPAHQVSRLRPGDLLLLDVTVGEPVACCVNGMVRFYGKMVQSGAKRAVLIERTVEKSDAA